jgi:N-acetyltransferase
MESATFEDLTPRLEGALVVLEPLAESHAEELWRAAQAPEIWQWLANLASRERFEQWWEFSTAAMAQGSEGVFAIRGRGSGEVIGSSRYLALRPENRALEIGWTWFNPAAWRTGANVETKLLMLGHAFETVGCVRVELKTDARNERSRKAMEAIPAQFEGVMRNHMIVPDVGQRDSAYFSVIDSEWPAVRANLEKRLSVV